MDIICRVTIKMDNCDHENILTCTLGNQKIYLAHQLASLCHIEVLDQNIKQENHQNHQFYLF